MIPDFVGEYDQMEIDDRKPRSVVCRVCGVESPANKLFCSGCGAYLQGEDEDTWIDLPLQQPASHQQSGAHHEAPSSTGPGGLGRSEMDLHWEVADLTPDRRRPDPAFCGRGAISEPMPERRPPKKRRHWLLAFFLVVILVGALGLTAAVAYRTIFAPKDGRATDGGSVTTRTSAEGGGSGTTTTQTTADTQTTTTTLQPQLGRLLEIASSMASSTLPAEGDNTYAASNVIDGDLGTCWSEGIDGQGEGEWIRLALHDPTTLATIEIANGYQKDVSRFDGNPRVAALRIEYSTGSTQTVQLYDSTGFQIVTPPPAATEWVKFVIQSTYPGETWQDTSISEIRLYESQ